MCWSFIYYSKWNQQGLVSQQLALAKKIPRIIQKITKERSVGKTANKIYGESDSMLLKVVCSNNKLDLICFADSFKDFTNYFFHSLWVLSLIAGKPFLRVGQCNIFMCTAEGLASIKFNKTFPIEQSCKGALTSISSPCCKVNRTLLCQLYERTWCHCNLAAAITNTNYFKHTIFQPTRPWSILPEVLWNFSKILIEVCLYWQQTKSEGIDHSENVLLGICCGIF